MGFTVFDRISAKKAFTFKSLWNWSVMGIAMLGVSCSSLSETIKAPDGFEVELTRYEPTGNTNSWILIIPPTGRENFIDRSYARMLARDGFQVVILKKWTDDYIQSLDISMHEARFSNAFRAAEMVKAKFDLNNFGILGTSVGALYGAMLVHEMDGISAAFSIVGGAPFPIIIANSDQDELRMLRDKRLASNMFADMTAYEKGLEAVLTHEAGERPKNRKIKLGMVISRSDEMVPTSSQKYLEKLWRPDTKAEFSSSHTMTVVRTWLFHSSLIRNFFKENLGAELDRNGS